MRHARVIFEVNLDKDVKPGELSEWIQFNLGVIKKIGAKNPLKKIKMTTNQVDIMFWAGNHT